ncbi:MAG: hypothetical protein IJ294_00610 [Clostridia bacterium]|nr:hypothetical protein [Clostridia bacterium]
MEIGWILGVVLFYFYTVSCAFLAVRIAALKGRKRSWGWLGAVLGLLGVAILCFLPNAKGVKGETNPIKAVFKKWTRVSPVAVWIVIVGVFVVAGGALLGNTILTAVENHRHAKELVVEEEDVAVLNPSAVYGAVADVFCGKDQQFAITEQGDLYGWGKLDLKPLGESDLLYKNAAKVYSAGETVYVLTKDGELYGVGNNVNALIPTSKEPSVSEFVLIDSEVKAATLSDTVGAYIKENGNLYVYGINTYHQLGSDQQRIDHTSYRLAEKAVKVVATARSLYYMAEDGTVYALGNNAYGQFGIGNKKTYKAAVKIATDCKDFAAGNDFTILLKKDGSVHTAGSNAYCQLGRQTLEEWEEEQKAIQTVQEEEEKPEFEKQVKFGVVELEKSPSAIGAGAHSAYALIGEELYGWGDNCYHQLGGGAVKQKDPKVIHKTVAEFSAGDRCVLVITQGGKLLGAGDRRYEQLGALSGEGFEAVAQIKEAK